MRAMGGLFGPLALEASDRLRVNPESSREPH
jgi:hypothetical protein